MCVNCMQDCICGGYKATALSYKAQMSAHKRYNSEENSQSPTATKTHPPNCGFLSATKAIFMHLSLKEQCKISMN